MVGWASRAVTKPSDVAYPVARADQFTIDECSDSLMQNLTQQGFADGGEIDQIHRSPRG